VSDQPSLFPAPVEHPASPAPWAAEPTHYVDAQGALTITGHYVTAADGTPVCRIDGTDATSSADLALILAAPVLLQQLRNLVGLAKIAGPQLRQYEAAIADADAAIASAVRA
jgi:hypothetical protein